MERDKISHSTTTWKPKKCEFQKIEVAKARKNSSVKWHFPRLYIGVAQQCTSGARCPPWKQHLYLPAPAEYVSILIPPPYIDEKLLGLLLFRSARVIWCH